MDDLHALPKFRDALSYLYVEHVRIDQQDQSIAIHDARGSTAAPVAALAVLMLGPGVSITHAAIRTLADNNCLVIWCGEENVRFYACGTGGTRSAAAIIHQARLVSQETTRLEVVKRMYRMRFGNKAEDPARVSGSANLLNVDTALSVEQLRGMEGARVRDSYAHLSRQYSVPWSGRNYDRNNWGGTDLVNRALSCANSCLYGLCHAAILAIGYSPALGFIHTGKALSFVYDIADLYKIELTVPVAFITASEKPAQLERAVRLRCRDIFRESRLLQRIVPDIRQVLGPPPTEPADEVSGLLDSDPALPTELWTPTGTDT